MLKSPKTNTLAGGLIEITSSTFEIVAKTVYKDKDSNPYEKKSKI